MLYFVLSSKVCAIWGCLETYFEPTGCCRSHMVHQGLVYGGCCFKRQQTVYQSRLIMLVMHTWALCLTCVSCCWSTIWGILLHSLLILCSMRRCVVDKHPTHIPDIFDLAFCLAYIILVYVMCFSQTTSSSKGVLSGLRYSSTWCK